MNLHRLTLIGATLLLTATAPAWAINKCVGPNGKAVFQDAPCAGQGGAVTVKPASGNGGGNGQATAPQPAATPANDSPLLMPPRPNVPPSGLQNPPTQTPPSK